MELEKSYQRYVRRQTADALIWNPVLGATLGTFDLAPRVVDEALHAGVATKRVLAWKETWIFELVETDCAGEHLLELAPSGAHLGLYCFYAFFRF